MTPIHKKRTDKRSVICGKIVDNVEKSIVIDEGDPVKMDSRKYVEHLQRGSKSKRYVLCDDCWDTYSHIQTI